MQYPSYSFQQRSGTSEFFFESIGPRGVVQKLVSFTPTEVDLVYNLGLADFDALTGRFDDLVVTDNGDTVKVLATILKIASRYFELFPERWVVFSGNSTARNRLYRIVINHSYQELTESFVLFGFWNDNWELFILTHHYELFLIRKR